MKQARAAWLPMPSYAGLNPSSPSSKTNGPLKIDAGHSITHTSISSTLGISVPPLTRARPGFHMRLHMPISPEKPPATGALVRSDLNPVLRSGPMDLDEAPFQSHQYSDFASLEAAEEDDDDFDDLYLESDFDKVQHHRQIPSKSLVIEIPTSTLIAPRASFTAASTFLSVSRERTAVRSLLESDPTQLDDDFIQFDLDDFVVYIDTHRFPQEMRALHTHATLSGQQMFYFDGTLKLGDVEHRVEKVPFEQIPLGNYGKDEPTVGDQLWIRSELNRKQNIYYQLKTPSIEYKRFHRDFLWVADLAKHVFDFSDHLLALGQNVSIRHFGQDFSQWLQTVHGFSPAFQKWHKKRGTDDFRHSIIANQPFIRKELFGMFDTRQWSRIHIFKEIADPFTMFSRHGLPSQGDSPTIVTPYIYDCFSQMEVGKILRLVQPSVTNEEAIARSWPADGTKKLRFIQTACTSQHRQTMIDNIKPGDTISMLPDSSLATDTKWSTTRLDKKWYGLVQGVSVVKSKMGFRRHFDITWLYDPEDTPCCFMRYPWRNELFLSDHCTCQEMRRNIPEDEVIGVHTVEWFGTPQTTADFFVRQTYQVEQRRWITLQKDHIRCRHEDQQRPEYLVGDTVLVSIPGQEFLEPCEILGFCHDFKNTRLRRLIRRTKIVGQCAPNELVYTDEEVSLDIRRIHTGCIVRCYYPSETIPAPYNRGGAGNAFIITHRKSHDGSVQPLSPANKPRIRQGFDPKVPVQKLCALDLFSGCGNFGRGLEDGGAVKARWVNDIWPAAIHTYIANCPDPDCVQPFLGSIDDFNLLSFEGNSSDSVPQPGQVGLICGGSPCPGFSLLTTDKETAKQVKNRSLVAAFAAAVDFHRPKYGILENVKTIVQSKANRTEDYFSQLICAIVGMGYQAQIILGDAWAHGAPQGRVRAFLYFSAPDLELPQPPAPSHSHPRNKEYGSLGIMTNGEPYVIRSNRPTPFKYVSALEATADLPDIYDAKTDTCVAFPDHRLSITLASGNLSNDPNDARGRNGRAQAFNMPTRPFAMNISRAWHHKIHDSLSGDTVQDMFTHEKDAYPRDGIARLSRVSNGWGRVHPHGLFHTVTTMCSWTDARIGCLSHWDQPRPLTVMEARRAQGLPDHEVLLGRPKEQWHMVGNAVARQMAMALGLALRKAWVGTLYEEEEGQAPADGFGPAGMSVEKGDSHMELDLV